MAMDAVHAQSDVLDTNLLNTWLTQLRTTRHRGTLVFSGEADWCRSMATQVVANLTFTRVTWVSTVAGLASETLPAKQARGLLGQERDVIVFDAHAGFDADAFGAVSGTFFNDLFGMRELFTGWSGCKS